MPDEIENALQFVRELGIPEDLVRIELDEHGKARTRMAYDLSQDTATLTAQMERVNRILAAAVERLKKGDT